MIKFNVGLCILAIVGTAFLFGQASAEPVVMIGEPPVPQKFNWDPDDKVFNFVVDFTVETLHVHFDQKPSRLESREGYQGAISGDAPGWDIKGALQSTPWQNVVPATDLAAEEDPNTDDAASKIVIPWDTSWAIPPDVDAAQWKPIFEQCRIAGRIGGVNNDSPCYVYRDRVEYRVWQNPSDDPVIYRLTFPGGY